MTSLLHFLLYLAHALIIFLLLRYLESHLAIGLIAAWCIFLRELTQKQSAKYDNNFFRGWAIWHWQTDKIEETVYPIGLGLGFIGLIVWWIS